MQITLDKSAIEALPKICELAPPKSSMPILSNVLIDASGHQVTVTGTDLDFFGRILIDAKISKPGRVAVNAETLARIVSLLSADAVDLELDGNKVNVQAGFDHYTLAKADPDDYPEWPEVSGYSELTIRQGDLKRALRHVMFAIPSKDPRKVIMGVYLDMNDGELACVATDGRKLGKAVIEPDAIEGNKHAHAIVPRGMMQKIEKLLGSEGDVQVNISEHQISFAIGDMTYISNLIVGTYPKYQAVIPKKFTMDIPIPREALLHVVNRAAIVAENKHHSVELHFSANEVVVKSRSFEQGSFDGKIDLEYIEDPLRIAFNHHYLSEVLKLMPDSTITMRVKTNTEPVVFRCASVEHTIWLVMPVRLGDVEDETAQQSAAEAG